MKTEMQLLEYLIEKSNFLQKKGKEEAEIK